jgi:hypothetical protein
MMIVKQSTKQNLKEIMRLTLINILNTKGIIYLHYKNKQKQRGKQCQKNMLQLKN